MYHYVIWNEEWITKRSLLALYCQICWIHNKGTTPVVTLLGHCFKLGNCFVQPLYNDLGTSCFFIRHRFCERVFYHLIAYECLEVSKYAWRRLCVSLFLFIAWMSHIMEVKHYSIVARVIHTTLCSSHSVLHLLNSWVALVHLRQGNSLSVLLHFIPLLQWAGITWMSPTSTLRPWRGRLRVAHLPSTPLLSSTSLLNEPSSQLGGPLMPRFGSIVPFWIGEERGGVSEAALSPPLGIELGLAGVNIQHSPHEWAVKNPR